ncbi:hypothetical protein PTQ19_10280 [Microbacterium esteraromaticum]|uniref:hypothetical protein n=1 Tax=Microbacterium esteraromaticum TaxID=57043 RepID=UPI002368DED4|nr:hypothetical protein [Microbacterium esteraromaticum]WDH77908.1 hypothetical protein PTQ19_10280 [Microbacterium esteraromaticum]
MAKLTDLKQVNIETLNAHQENIAEKEAALAGAIRARDEFVRGMLAMNYSPTAIADVLGVTRGRVHQIGKS